MKLGYVSDFDGLEVFNVKNGGGVVLAARVYNIGPCIFRAFGVGVMVSKGLNFFGEVFPINDII